MKNHQYIQLCICCILSLIGTVNTLQSQVPETVLVQINILNSAGETSTRLTAGVMIGATEEIDTIAPIREEALPPIHPPGGLHAAFSLVDRGGNVFTYKDIRNLGSGTKFEKVHEINISQPIEEREFLIFRWQPITSAYVDSVVIQDKLTGTLARIKLRREFGEDTLRKGQFGGGPANLNLFRMTIYYSATPVTVREDAQNIRNEQNMLTPNPATEAVTVTTDGVTSGMTLYSIDGQVIELQEKPHIDGKTSTINVSTLTPGIYLIVLYDINGRITRSKFVKY